MEHFDYIVIGGGIVGLSTAMHLIDRFPGSTVAVLEKEREVCRHQSGRNSGVIHSGVYYTPGSLKARLATRGARSMVSFCRDYGLPYEICGKLIVATNKDELPGLETLYRRGIENGVPVRKIRREEAKEFEPHVDCVAALHVASTGVVSYRSVCEAICDRIREQSGVVLCGQEVIAVETGSLGIQLESRTGDRFAAGYLINCGGLYSDRLTEKSGLSPGARIVPFRGEYFELIPERRNLVRGLIYPVPNPAFPFLGVHFTRMIDGSVHAGPNAVLALAREGYRKPDWVAGELWDTLRFSGFWKLLMRHHREAAAELWRSLSQRAFAGSLQRLVPEVKMEDLRPCPSGVRAQALWPDGRLVEDFLLIEGKHSLHVCNAPSPAATASLEIGREIVGRVPRRSAGS